MKSTYLYDGSFDGFLTIVFNSFKFKNIPSSIKKEDGYEYNLFDNAVNIETNKNKSNRVKEGIKRVSLYSFQNIKDAFLSDEKAKENIIFDYIINLFRFGEKLCFMRNIPSVIDLEILAKNVRREAHRFKGFVRFEELDNKVYYAKIEPDNDILEILCNHFKTRLKNEAWIIYDTKRNKAAFYNKKEYIILNTKNADFNKLKNSDVEISYQKLWKSFYKSVNIKERKNLRCQRNFMPKKYWKNICEVGSINNE